jgi:hypothetical protein
MAARRATGERAGRQLDHERGRAREAVVLPADRRAVVARQPAGGQPDAAGVGAHRRAVGAARQDDEPHVLVVVEREVGLDIGDERLQRTGLGLGRAARAGVVRLERPPAAGPPVREVAVEIDAAGVLARPGAHPVGVRALDEPELDTGGRREPAQPPHHRMPRRLVAVDRADHQHARGRAGIADPLDLERAPAGRGPVCLGSRRGGREQHEQDGNDECGAHLCASC